MSDIEDLIEYAALEGTEIADECFSLDLININREFYSPEFVEAYTKEIKRFLKFFRMNAMIIETKKEVTTMITNRNLEWRTNEIYWPTIEDMNDE